MLSIRKMVLTLIAHTVHLVSTSDFQNINYNSAPLDTFQVIKNMLVFVRS